MRVFIIAFSIAVILCSCQKDYSFDGKWQFVKSEGGGYSFIDTILWSTYTSVGIDFNLEMTLDSDNDTIIQFGTCKRIYFRQEQSGVQFIDTSGSLPFGGSSSFQLVNDVLYMSNSHYLNSTAEIIQLDANNLILKWKFIQPYQELYMGHNWTHYFYS